MKHQSLREVFKITEWRGGCVYRTKPVGYAWITLDHNSTDKDTVFCPISTSLMTKLQHKTIRRVEDTINDVVTTTLEELGVK